MDFISVIHHEIVAYFTPDKIMSWIRLSLIFVFGIPIVLLLSKWTKKQVTHKVSAQQGMIFSKLVFYAGLAFIIVSLLNEFGFKLSHLLGAAGIVGIALGFASQTSVSNIISGIFLIAEKTFQINDTIIVGGTTGVVLSIDMLSVKLRTYDNRFVRIPNETLIKTEVVNITRFPIRRADISVGVAYKEDIGKVREVLMDVARQNPLCLNEPEPLVFFSGYGNSSIDLILLVWATKEDWLKMKNSIQEEIKARFDRDGIEIPFPHLSLYTGSVTQPLPIRLVNDAGEDGKMPGQTSETEH